jgi:hypothetical protein
MNFANLIYLTNVEMGLIFIEGSVLLSFFIIYLYLKKRLKRPSSKENLLETSHPLRKWVQESETICQGLSRNLEEKKEIAKRLIAQLEEKIQSLDSMMKRMEEEVSSLSGKAGKKDLSPRIHEMAEAGCDVSDIARELHLSKGEVQLALDLKRYCQ